MTFRAFASDVAVSKELARFRIKVLLRFLRDQGTFIHQGFEELLSVFMVLRT